MATFQLTIVIVSVILISAIVSYQIAIQTTIKTVDKKYIQYIANLNKAGRSFMTISDDLQQAYNEYYDKVNLLIEEVNSTARKLDYVDSVNWLLEHVDVGKVNKSLEGEKDNG